MRTCAGDVDLCLVPEVAIELEGVNGCLPFLMQRIAEQGHAVVVVAEGIQCHSFHLHLFYLSSSFLSSSLSFFPPSFLSPFRTLYCLLINYILPYPLRSTTCFHSLNFFLFLFSLILLYSYLRRLSRIVYVKTNIFQFCLDSSPRHHSLLIS